ncbi:MAG TPA: universal stress protein [Geobacteraceae bacterium]|nr:universal stress protein [Geobacteraceae bacterium]
MAEIRKILAMCGISRCCQEVIDYSIAMARNNNAELFFIHIIHNPFGLEGWNLPMMSLDEDYFNLLAETKEDLEKIVAREKKNGLKIRGLIKEGRPTDEILKTIKEENIDLLIMHAQEETAVERLESRLENFLFGASSKEIIRKMPCSILLLKRGPESECI